MPKMNRALISVSNKQGIVEFARDLQKLDLEIISTGGTAKLLKENGIYCRHVSEITGLPELLDGRVKTLHPFIHGGILAERNNQSHLQQLKETGIELIDLVAVNLYPFEKVITQKDITLERVLENIDIGGTTMIRAAAKNYHHVAVVIDPSQYRLIIEELQKNGGDLSLTTLRRLAIEAFQLTTLYDSIVAKYLSRLEDKTTFPQWTCFSLSKIQDLRYGENPHQKAAFYYNVGKSQGGITQIQQLHGKELSYNNIADIDSAVRIVTIFNDPCCVIIKHNNPCGVAIGDDSYDAFQKAFATDSLSAFGGIFGFNRIIDLKLAEELKKVFIEVIIAPDYNEDAMRYLKQKKNLRLLKLPIDKIDGTQELIIKNVLGGFLLQEGDYKEIADIDFKVVSKRKPTASEWAALKFGWQVVKWVKSNAIVFVKKDRTIGIGAGQMSRVDSVILAEDKANRAGLSLRGTVVASDAFFPFRDGVDKAAKAGATAIIQPGGSVRDGEVIKAADEHNMAMIFTNVRHFRH